MEEIEKTEICYYEDNNRLFFFNKKEEENTFINIQDKEERKSFVNEISNLSGCGIRADEEDLSTYDEVLNWIINSELPLILDDNCCISRIPKVFISKAKMGEKINFTDKKTAIQMAKKFSEEFVEYSDEAEKVLTDRYGYTKEELESITEKLFLGFISDLSIDELIDNITKSKLN